ncbi:alpha-tocopherol transfer protein-like [Pieris brassicae]|nr:alpha-tocopherol transfer protein-like [Pieris brassicae]
MPDQELAWTQEIVPLRNWLNKQPHLPHDVEDVLLHRFYLSCHKSLERAKRTMDLFFTMRSSTPDLFCKRDPCSAEIRKVFEITDMLPLPTRTKDNYNVFIYRLREPDLDMFSFLDAVKTFFMLIDTRLTEEHDIPSGEIPIFDAANVSLKFVGKVNLSVLRKYMMYTQEAVPVRLKQVHVINSPSYIGKIFALCKPFLKNEVAKLIKFHEPNSETLYTDIPKDILPEEYGGACGSVDQIKRYWIKRMEAKRNWFLENDKNWFVEESLRPANCRDEKIEKIRDLPGSFRSLALD